MLLTSTAFQSNTTLPVDYTCKGKGINPPLSIADIPAEAQSLALIMHDPDAVSGQDFLHWAIWNITPDTTEINEGILPSGVHQGTNDYPTVAYGPACPPAGTGVHHYIFDLYALDSHVLLPNGANRESLQTAIQDHIVATAQLVGIVES